MKLAKLFLGDIEFGTHMVSTDGHWNGFSLPFIKEGDMESFSQKVNDAFFECGESYDLLMKVDGEWVWNEYLIEGDKTTLEFTTPISSFERDGVTYYDIQIGHIWEHEEVA